MRARVEWPTEWVAAAGQFQTWYENPGAFAFDCFADPYSPSGRLELRPDQVQVMQAVGRGEDVTWRSAHGVGKTTTLAILVFWYLLLRAPCKIPTTAPTWRQVGNLWDEIHTWYARYRWRSYFSITAKRLGFISREHQWFAEGIASNRPENIEGKHARDLLYMVDEAKGVTDPIFDAIDGACTDGGQRIYVSTPGARQGKFYESHVGKLSRFFTVLHTDGEGVPHLAKWAEQKRVEWGPDSPIYIAKVRGEFPQEGDDVLYPLNLLDAAVEAFEEVDEHGQIAVPHRGRFAVGVDVARLGFDRTVALGGSITRLDTLEQWHHATIDETVGRVQAFVALMQAHGTPPDVLAVDATGLGAGAADYLRVAGLPVEDIHFGAAPTEDGRPYFVNAKAEMAWALRLTLETNARERLAGRPGSFGLRSNDRLLGQLSAMRRRYQGGRLAIVDPDDPSIPAGELARGLKVSPDHAHAAIIAHHATALANAQFTGIASGQSPLTTQTARERMARFSRGLRVMR